MAYEISETYFKLAIVKSESITNLFFYFPFCFLQVSLFLS